MGGLRSLTPGPRVPAVMGNRVVLRDGVPVASVQSGEMHWHTEADEATRSAVLELLAQRRSDALRPSRRRATAPVG